MTPEEFKALRGKTSQVKYGLLIGRSQRHIKMYESGRSGIPKSVELACCAVYSGILSIKDIDIPDQESV